MTPFKAKLVDAQTAAVARRAFGGPIDVRPLLPVFEEKIGDMMRRAVPAELRPKRDYSEHSQRQRAERDARIATAGEMARDGASIREIGDRLGVCESIALQYTQRARAQA